MNSSVKLALFLITTLFLATSCNSSTSDAKKVEVRKVATTASMSDQVNTTDNSDKTGQNADSDNVNTVAGNELAAAKKFKAGVHYVEIFPEMNTDASPGKVEVVELMWLGCPHCYELEPTIEEYKKNQPEYVEFKQVPATLNPVWAADAETFYIAQILDPQNKKQLVTKLFHAIHEQRRRLNKPEAAKRFLLEQGFSEEQFNNAKNSLAFRQKISRAGEISQGSQATSVPSIIVNGKYRTSPYMAGGEQQLLQVIDYLTRKEKL